MKTKFSRRMHNLHNSYLREIFVSAKAPGTISFAGGLPNPQFFPTEAIAEATAKILKEKGSSLLQYGFTEGYPPLREFIAQRYGTQYGLTVKPEEILITTGSQQGLDLLGKVFLNPGDQMALESPGYLGAILSFSFYEPDFVSVPLLEDGIDIERLGQAFQEHEIKLFYGVTNFQNPSGLTYSEAKRQQVAELLEQYDVFFVEDNPYGELRYSGQDLPPMPYYSRDKAITLGSFSKIASPGFRLGWIFAPPEVIAMATLAKQGADLQSSSFAQGVLYQYLCDNDIEAHIAIIKQAYKAQRDLMIAMVEELFPPEVGLTRPDGGMFLWLTLPEGQSAFDLFYHAVEEGVVFVPGKAFHVDGGGENTLRLSFSNSDQATLETGMQRLAKAVKRLLSDKQSVGQA